MSVSLLEVIESAGYNQSTIEGAQWLLSKKQEVEELIEKAETLIDDADEEEDDDEE